MNRWRSCSQTNNPMEENYQRHSQGELKHSRREERTLIEELEKIIIGSDQQIKRLNQTITKLIQKSKNKEIFYQSKIQQLEQQNEEYKQRLEVYEGEKGEKMRRNQTRNSSKNGKQAVYWFCRSERRENNENVNTLNIENQPCSNPQCAQQRAKARSQYDIIAREIDKLLCSLRLRSTSSFDEEEYSVWQKQLKDQKRKRKGDEEKSPVVLLKNLQNKLAQLDKLFDLDCDSKRLSDPLLKALKDIRVKSTNLIKIPFLEKIDLEERKEEYSSIIRICKERQHHIRSLLENKYSE